MEKDMDGEQISKIFDDENVRKEFVKKFLAKKEELAKSKTDGARYQCVDGGILNSVISL